MSWNLPSRQNPLVERSEVHQDAPAGGGGPGNFRGPRTPQQTGVLLADARAKPTLPMASQPMVFVGDLEGLFPRTAELKVRAGPKAPEQTITVEIPDWRQLPGFRRALLASLAEQVPRYTNHQIQGLEKAAIQMVNSGQELYDGVRKAGVKQVIFFGHSEGSQRWDRAVGLAAAGLGKPGLSAARLSEALAGEAPTPIALACLGGTLQLTRQGKKELALGPKTFVEVTAYDLDVNPGGGLKLGRGAPLIASDLFLKRFVEEETKGFPRYIAPDVSLRQHVPSGPP